MVIVGGDNSKLPTTGLNVPSWLALYECWWLRAPEQIQFKLADLCRSVWMGQHRHTPPMSFSAWPISRPKAASTPLPHYRWLSVIHCCPPSVIEPSRLLLSVLGTICTNMSRLHPLCLLSEDARRLSSSGALPPKWHLSFSDTNHLFTYLLTYLLTYLPGVVLCLSDELSELSQ